MKTILKENSTHKAVKENNQISIYLKGFDIEDIHQDETLMYSISEDMEDDVFAIFERYDEDNRINMAELRVELAECNRINMAEFKNEMAEYNF